MKKRNRDSKEVIIKQGGESYYKNHCDMITDEIKKCDGLHMTPGYKRFTLI